MAGRTSEVSGSGPLAERVRALVAEGAPPSRLVETVLEEALAAGASDVHFEPLDSGLAVRLRLDGVLREAAALPADLAAPVVARLKVLAGLATYRTDVPQDGLFQLG
jgi:general secretion pathway protein E